MFDILIVEDGERERARLTKLLTEAGYSVVDCENVEQGKAALAREKCRLAILDIGLGDRSGSYLFNFIKQQSRASFIIIYTGNPSAHLKKRFIDEGAVEYIVKASPEAEDNRILTRVAELLGEAPLSGEGEKDLTFELGNFLERHLTQSARTFFYDGQGALVPCTGCQSRSYVIDFSSEAQFPPEVKGFIYCSKCKRPMDSEIA